MSEAKASALDLLEEKPKRVRRKPERVEAACPRHRSRAEPPKPATEVTLAEQKAQALSIWTDETEKNAERKRSAEEAKPDSGAGSAASLLKPISKILAEKEETKIALKLHPIPPPIAGLRWSTRPPPRVEDGEPLDPKSST